MHELTVHNSPQQNGVAERANHTLVENTRVMLFRTGFPKALWAEAVNHAAYLKNRSPTCALVDKMPHQMVHGSKPDLTDMHRFGCPVYIQVENTGKLNEQVKLCKFVGYDYNSKHYRILWPDTRHISIERNIHFPPDDPSLSSEDVDVQFEGAVIDTATSSSPPGVSPSPATALPAPQPTQIPLPLSPLTMPPLTPPAQIVNLPSTPPAPSHRYSQRIFNCMQCANAIWETLEADAEELGLSCDKLHAATEHADNPLESDDQSVEEALNGPNTEQWQRAMDEEIAAIKKNGTWELVNPPLSANIICSHFILKVKCDKKGEVSCYKARLVANGNTQCEGIDFNETFAAVAKLLSI